MFDPIAQFTEWFAEAQASVPEPTAMTLATATPEGKPSARIVLLKQFDARGFVFYTNFASRKGIELLENPHAALVFFWQALDKQVRIEGTIAPVGDAEADAYFASRTRLKQAGACASLQSQPMDRRETLAERVAAVEAQYSDQAISRPPHWSGFRLAPERIEFWHQREGRLHERDRFTRQGNGWDHQLLYP